MALKRMAVILLIWATEPISELAVIGVAGSQYA